MKVNEEKYPDYAAMMKRLDDFLEEESWRTDLEEEE